MDENVRPIGRPPEPPNMDEEPRQPPPYLMTADQYQALIESINAMSQSIDHVFTCLESLERTTEQRWNSTVTNNDVASLTSNVKDLHRRVNRIESALGKSKVATLQPKVT